MLAAQASKHGVQPTTQPLPAGLFTAGAPTGPAAMLENDAGRHGSIPPFMSGGRPGLSNGSYQVVPPSHQSRPPPPSQPLPAPPSGLPARPPPSQAGYGGPQGFLPPGFNQSQQPQAGFPPAVTAPPPPGFPLPPGFGPSPNQGGPPNMPSGFQQPVFARTR